MNSDVSPLTTHHSPLTTQYSPEQIATVDAIAAAHPIGLAAVGTRGGRARKRFSSARAVRLANLVDVLALGARHFLGHAPAFQVGLDLAGREIAILGVLRQVDLDQLVKPALVRGHGAAARKLLFQ